ncbi:MAG: outer membrane lipoprotein carrier protein LolA [Flavobacterium sp.]|jgi:outer membrane lipoprotein-sorting protein|uniref:LolA family protein n=2 Tax=Flavobacterium sp. TaxID=239 RepID=UPI001B635630|nr:outer membrane lipoprotein carrier protein LolA [Flavobacterium sp.]MBP6146672.1 outer membrane lipoprotein carrier protein LolA [Flavobacterium sp.]MBP7182702.1 outer membrane lipoprotein carrier protein LolA [Flavobacterium sp.]MBP7317574.1 outer membrane lipoprotein carrier protein LolA [Flavobacterium sp.]MBP8887066.1 outer membrane lipoprotein carrier protein LolA [Flavobacterium sp.]HRL70833.1 outer membrane lipoprotein carrier protein LolA [Flavobacterium sp.]
MNKTTNPMIIKKNNTETKNIAKKFLLIASLLLFSFSIQAQDKKAKDLLDQVTAKVKSYNNIAIDFKYSLNNSRENINQDSKGNVTMKGNQYVLNFMGVTKIFDGKKTYTIVPEDEEITISTVNEKDDNAITPSKMLTFFNTGYKYNMDILQNVKGRKIQYIKLVPLNSRDQRKEVLLGIDVQTKHIYNLIEVGKKGTKTTLTVNSFKTNQPLSKNQFTFAGSKYPNYYINKLD